MLVEQETVKNSDEIHVIYLEIMCRTFLVILLAFGLASAVGRSFKFYFF